MAWCCLSKGEDDRSGNASWTLTYWFIFCLWRIFSSVSSRLEERILIPSPRWADMWTEKKTRNAYLCWVQVVLWSDCDFCFSVVAWEYLEDDFDAEQSLVGAVVDSAEIVRVVLRQSSYPSRRSHLTKDDYLEWEGQAVSSHSAAYLSKSIVPNSIEAAMGFDDSSHWYSPRLFSSPRSSRRVHCNRSAYDASSDLCSGYSSCALLNSEHNTHDRCFHQLTLERGMFSISISPSARNNLDEQKEFSSILLTLIRIFTEAISRRMISKCCR